MSRYASNTNVSVEKSRTEIEQTLARYGADQFMYGWDQNRALLAFRFQSRHVRFKLELPLRSDFAKTDVRRVARRPEEIEKHWEQACRQRFRALALVIKAKLEAIDCGISCFDDEFLAFLVLPNGKSVSDWMQPQLTAIYDRGEMPNLLPAK